jgi:hypothetical protein
MKNYYAILGVTENAEAAEIKKAYRTLAVKYHPDKNPSAEATLRFTEITEAYDVLSDANKKFVYDHQWYKFIHQLVHEEPVQQHRDPRYGARPKASVRREKPAHLQLMEKWNRYANWVNLAGMIMVIVFVADIFLPTIDTEETVTQVWIIKGRRGVSHYKVHTESGKKIKVYNNMVMPGEKLELSVSPIYRMPMTVVNITEPRQGIVSSFSRIIFPALLLVIAVLGVFQRKNVEQAFSYCVGTAILLILNFFLIF